MNTMERGFNNFIKLTLCVIRLKIYFELETNTSVDKTTVCLRALAIYPFIVSIRAEETSYFHSALIRLRSSQK